MTKPRISIAWIIKDRGIGWVDKQRAIALSSYDKVYSIIQNEPPLNKREYIDSVIRRAYDLERNQKEGLE